MILQDQVLHATQHHHGELRWLLGCQRAPMPANDMHTDEHRHRVTPSAIRQEDT